MDTGRLRRFATEARKVLMQGVAQRLMAVGFNEDGSHREEPILYEGGSTFMGKTESEGFHHQWKSLQHAIETKSYKSVVEEAAYTWFNRLTATQILSKNGLISNVLEFEAEDIRVPSIVREARQGRLPQMDRETSERLNTLLQDDSKTNEQFQLLIVAFCHSTPVINNCFGRITDWTELLLPTDILSEGGFLNMLNHTEFIAEEDWHSPELIGWLYQFYISERKDEVFAKKGKVEADEIPAATQIFTPNWIVKYMVQNTVGRIYLDNNPNEAAEIAPKWQYLVEQSEPTPPAAVYHCDDLTKLKLADLACGSGHILNEFFDLLFDLYLHDGYSVTNAVRNIFTCNILGIDIDSRAKQLATFALLLKACQKDRSFANAQCMPRIYDMPQPYEDKSGLGRVLRKFIQGQDERAVGELESAIALMDNADSLGSIMKFKISERVRETVATRMEEWGKEDSVPEDVLGLFPYINIILALTDKYSALVMNPPYMGRSGMNNLLTDYVHNYYEMGKWDLYAAFMIMGISHLLANGKLGMITMHSWMFLDSFTNLRNYFLQNFHFDNMLHLGPNTFDELNGEIVQNTSYVVSNNKAGSSGTYFRLTYGKNCGQKNTIFLAKENCCFKVEQNKFQVIPGSPIAYWLNDKWFDLFKMDNLGDYVISKAGIVSGNDEFFVKYWHEVSFNEICFNSKTPYEKYYPFQKGGMNRRYYGNNDFVFRLRDLWDNRFFNVSMRRGDVDSYFKMGIGWSNTGSTEAKAFRAFNNCVCGTSTPLYLCK